MNGRVRSLGSFAGAALLLACMTLGGCTPWPVSATGGAAERHGTDWREQLEIERRYSSLIEQGGEQWAPAKLQEARELLVRARREYAGGLVLDANATLGAATSLIAELEPLIARRAKSTRAR